MKKKILWGLLTLASVSWTGCSTDDAMTDSPVTNFNEEQDVSISFYDVSMKPIDSYMGTTRADDAKFGFTRLDVAMIGKDTTLLFQQYSADEEFGKLKVKAPMGSYQLVAIASNYDKDKVVDIQSPTSIIVPTERLTDMQQTVTDIEVKEGGTTASCVLKRSVAKFVIQCTDVPPKEARYVNLKVTGNCGTSLNPTTGNSNDKNGYLREMKAYPDGTTSIKSATYTIYFLLGSSEESVTIDVNILDATQKTTFKSWKFENVKMKQGYVTTYKGALFSADAGVNFTFGSSEFPASGTDKTF